MSNFVLMMMLFVSISLGFCALLGLIWGIRNKQFDDYRKFLGGTKFDDEDSLNDAYTLEKRKEEAVRKRKEDGYMPPD